MGKKKSVGDCKVAIGYVRVSTDDQSLGQDAQRSTIEAWSAREGVRIVAWHVDAGVSGASTLEERPALLSAISALTLEGAGLLVVAKRDRIARDVVIAALIERAAASQGARLISADGTGNGTTPADEFMRTVIDGAAAYERALIRARTKAALAAKKARGEMTGAPPYGYQLSDDGVHLVQCAVEQAVITLVRDMKANGARVCTILGRVNAEGHVSRRGKPFARTQIVNMVSKCHI